MSPSPNELPVLELLLCWSIIPKLYIMPLFEFEKADGEGMPVVWLNVLDMNEDESPPLLELLLPLWIPPKKPPPVFTSSACCAPSK